MLKLMYITNDPTLALIAEEAGVDRIFVDLETVGKDLRQGGMDTVQSHHTVADVAALGKVLTRARLLVRVNQLHEGSRREIDAVIEAGADLVMLPYFHTASQAETFLNLVAGRAKTVLLFETARAVACADEILALGGMDECYIGLNDLHLSYGQKFLFEPLADGTVEAVCGKFARAGKPYGFGGIARVGTGALPAQRIIGEHIRLGSSRVILSRSFFNADRMSGYEEARTVFGTEVPKVRAAEAEYARATPAQLLENRRFVEAAVKNIVETMP